VPHGKRLRSIGNRPGSVFKLTFSSIIADPPGAVRGYLWKGNHAPRHELPDSHWGGRTSQPQPQPGRVQADATSRAGETGAGSWVRRHHIESVILTRKNQPRQASFDKVSFRQRNRIERVVGHYKECRALATRYEKFAVDEVALWRVASRSPVLGQAPLTRCQARRQPMSDATRASDAVSPLDGRRPQSSRGNQATRAIPHHPGRG
jgi:hypothetical protein